ncbi:adenylyltransferase/cytidyltransferase family protein [bacterium]|nr:adenylyltransferase/cytidyltransferase family protein [bacterium]
MTKAIIVSGYFNPLHIGHLELLENAKKASDLLIVIVNSDLQRKLKGSKEFQTEDERLAIVRAIRYVDIAYVSIDEDATQIETLKMLKQRYGLDAGMDLTFANGGDQNNDTIPERSTCEQYGIHLLEGLGNKIQSSSWLLNNK